MQGEKPEEVTKRLLEYIKFLKKLTLLDWKILCYYRNRGIY